MEEWGVLKLAKKSLDKILSVESEFEASESSQDHTQRLFNSIMALRNQNKLQESS